MFQKGIFGVAGGTVDDLTYHYFSASNKLSDVSEATPVDNKLGDFTDNHTGSNDYGYDVNGNLITDMNKRLKKDRYPAATMETAQAAIDKLL